jgi:hypothetical protein
MVYSRSVVKSAPFRQAQARYPGKMKNGMSVRPQVEGRLPRGTGLDLLQKGKTFSLYAISGDPSTNPWVDAD